VLAGLGRVRRGVERPRPAVDNVGRDYDFLDSIERGQFEHGFEEYSLHDGTKAARACPSKDGALRNGAHRFFLEAQLDALHLEHALVLFHQCVLRFREDALERRLVEIFQRRDHGKTTDEFRDQAVFEQILRLDLAEDLALFAILRGMVSALLHRHRLSGTADTGIAGLELEVRATLGDRGCVAVDREETGERLIYCPAFPVVPGADRTSCGDTFRAALLTYLLRAAVQQTGGKL